MYCVRCRTKTDTQNIQKVITKNNRNMLRGNCVVCGCVKTQFTKAADGGSLNTIINKLPFEMHLPGHNFTGPGTKLNKRLNPDRTPKRWSKPINRVDNASYHHDLCYNDNQSTSVRNKVCDKNMLNELKSIVNPTIRERAERFIVNKVIKSKVNLGLGLKKKSCMDK